MHDSDSPSRFPGEEPDDMDATDTSWSDVEEGDDLLELIDAPPEEDSLRGRHPWVVAVVDDDLIVHEVTRTVLADFSFEGRPIEFLSARSAREARSFFLARKDIALAIIDVVMETETAGLDLLRFIREEAGCHLTRLVLRTGQPGLAPEGQIIHRYDLHDYWEKTELSARKLITVVHSALRAYRDLQALEASRQGVRRLLELAPSLQSCQNLESFAKSAFALVRQTLGEARTQGFVGVETNEGIVVLESLDWLFAPGERLPQELELPLVSCEELTGPAACGLTFRIGREGFARLVFHLEGPWSLTDEDERLIGLLRHQLEVQLDNLRLWIEALDAQFETIHILADAVETRSKETGAHTRRVGEVSLVLGRQLGFDPQRLELLHRAAPLHDLGKIAIPDSILNKPGKLSPDEWAVMKTHATVGYEILARSARGPMRMAALIARDHHEKWDGTGYPQGLKGKEISEEGRIVALADVVDALLSSRCYKKPWPLEDVLTFVREQRGRHFDPDVVDAFFQHLPEFLALRRAFPDEELSAGD